MSYTAHGVTADGERVPLPVTAETGATGLVVPSVHLDGQAFDRVVVDAVPDEPLHEEWHGSDGGVVGPGGGWVKLDGGSRLDVGSLLDAPLDAVEVEPIRVGPGCVVDPDALTPPSLHRFARRLRRMRAREDPSPPMPVKPGPDGTTPPPTDFDG